MSKSNYSLLTVVFFRQNDKNYHLAYRNWTRKLKIKTLHNDQFTPTTPTRRDATQLLSQL